MQDERMTFGKLCSRVKWKRSWILSIEIFFIFFETYGKLRLTTRLLSLVSFLSIFISKFDDIRSDYKGEKFLSRVWDSLERFTFAFLQILYHLHWNQILATFILQIPVRSTSALFQQRFLTISTVNRIEFYFLRDCGKTFFSTFQKLLINHLLINLSRSIGKRVVFRKENVTQNSVKIIQVTGIFALKFASPSIQSLTEIVLNLIVCKIPRKLSSPSSISFLSSSIHQRHERSK